MRAVLLLLLATSAAHAQWPVAVSPFVPADHWSFAVLRRLDAAGLLPAGSDPARRSIPQEEIAALIGFAAQSDSTGSARKYLDRFREEFSAPRVSGISRLDAAALLSYRLRENQVAAGKGDNSEWSGARALDDVSSGAALVRSALAGRLVAGAVSFENDEVSELQAIISAGAVAFWGGRMPLGYATAHSGGIVIDKHTFDAVGMWLTRPLQLPIVGAVRVEMHLSRIDNLLLPIATTTPTDTFALEPWFWMAHGSIQPHRRLRLGLTRGVMFGGKGNRPVTAERLFNTMIGIYTANKEHDFANQLFSADARYNAATGSIPVSLYLDWGAADGAGAWYEAPAIVGGIEASLQPRYDLLIGLELTHFGKESLGQRSFWYRDNWFRGSWADDGAVLGHAIGGHGSEWRAFVAAGSAQRGITLDAAAYARTRGEQNLYAPERQGKSTGAAIEVGARLNSSLRVLLEGELERGSEAADWTSTRARAALKYRF